MSGKQNLQNANGQNLQYRKQVFENNLHTYYAYSNPDFPAAASYAGVYSNINLQQTDIPQNQNCCLSENMCTFQSDQIFWDNRTAPDAEKSMKTPEKTDSIEINKDISPSSYCSNLDVVTSESNYYNRYDNQWFYQSDNYNNYPQKNIEYPSCAYISKNTSNVTSKYFGTDGNLSRNSSYYLTPPSCYASVYKNNTIPNSSHDLNSYNFYPNKYQDITSTNGNNFYSIVPLDQQTEVSNDESDIIVEESDEDQTDFSEDQEKKVYQVNKCLVCDVVYTPLGLQFYFLTLQNPLTMSSQKPVLLKLFDIIGSEVAPKNYLCSSCLGLINTIDHLQLKLDSFINDIKRKFYNTCTQNSVESAKNYLGSKMVIKPKRNNSKFKCPVCKKILCLRKYYQFHLAKHKFQGYLCELCGTICKKKKQFVFHLKKHKVLNLHIPAFKCKNCEKMFRTRSNLKEHQNFCSGLLPFACKHQNCDKKFASASKLKNHTKLKHDKKFIAICSICNIGFVKVSDYKSHMISHSTDKKYSCKKCDKSYKTLSNLNFHMKMHEKILPFICDICQKGFMRKEYLESHLNNHKGIKNFACTICPKRFVSQKNLDAHLKCHEGAERKTCNICSKIIKSGYEDHLRMHSNMGEFECDICDLKFNTKGTLLKHRKRKHSQKVDNVEVIDNSNKVSS